MAPVARYLADRSALARLRHLPVAEVLGPLIEAGLVATCGVIEFELAWAAWTSRSSMSCGRTGTRYVWLATLNEDWRRALQVQAELWRSGQMRSVGLPDLLVAAVAEGNTSLCCTMTPTTTWSRRSRASPCDGSSPAGPSRSRQPGRPGQRARPARRAAA